MMISDSKLLELALKASKEAYAPYSHFHVGAALRTASGEIYTGCNVENRSYGLTICAERNAIFKAVSEGHREFSIIAITSPDSVSPLPPCGACRQVLSEFSPDMVVIYSGSGGEVVKTTMSELYPQNSLTELAKS